MFWLFFCGDPCFYLGKLKEARAYYEVALDLWDPTYRAIASTPEDGYVAGQMYLSRTLLCLGYIDQAILRRDDAVAEARRLSPYALAWALSNAWYGDWALQGVNAADTMLECAEEVLAISSQHGFPLFLGIGSVMRGWSLGALGQAKEGIATLLQGIAKRRAEDCRLMVPLCLVALADAHGISTSPQEGLKWLDEAFSLIETTQERWAEAEMHQRRGTLLLSIQQPTAAEDSYHQALAVAQRQNAKFWELRAATRLGCLWRDQGKREQARDLLAPIYNWFTEGLDTPVLNEAKVLLDELA